jgi:hypothetical protein
MIEVFRNDFFVVGSDGPSWVVEVVRSSVGFGSSEEAAAAFTPMLECLDGLGRHRYSLLFDARWSVANNHPDYEAWYARYRAELVRGFQRVAILMRTPAGSLQATRLLPPTTSPARVFLDPARAWAFVTEPSAVRSSRRPLASEEEPLSRGVSLTPDSSGRAQRPRVRSRLPPTG